MRKDTENFIKSAVYDLDTAYLKNTKEIIEWLKQNEKLK